MLAWMPVEHTPEPSGVSQGSFGGLASALPPAYKCWAAQEVVFIAPLHNRNGLKRVEIHWRNCVLSVRRIRMAHTLRSSVRPENRCSWATSTPTVRAELFKRQRRCPGFLPCPTNSQLRHTDSQNGSRRPSLVTTGRHGCRWTLHSVARLDRQPQCRASLYEFGSGCNSGVFGQAHSACESVLRLWQPPGTLSQPTVAILPVSRFRKWPIRNSTRTCC